MLVCARRLAVLLTLTERCCVVRQTLRAEPGITVTTVT
jgi:hypothetical protein